MNIIKKDLHARLCKHLNEIIKDLSFKVEYGTIYIYHKSYKFLFMEFGKGDAGKIEIDSSTFDGKKKINVNLIGEDIENKSYDFDELSNALKLFEKKNNVQVTIEIEY